MTRQKGVHIRAETPNKHSTDRRSSQAAIMLIDAGFTDVRVIQGGMTAWRAKGWPVLVH